jgi:hypothetical protein
MRTCFLLRLLRDLIYRRHGQRFAVHRRAMASCNVDASSQGARIQTSLSSSVARITGMAFGWIGATIAVGAVVRKP